MRPFVQLGLALDRALQRELVDVHGDAHDGDVAKADVRAGAELQRDEIRLLREVYDERDQVDVEHRPLGEVAHADPRPPAGRDRHEQRADAEDHRQIGHNEQPQRHVERKEGHRLVDGGANRVLIGAQREGRRQSLVLNADDRERGQDDHAQLEHERGEREDERDSSEGSRRQDQPRARRRRAGRRIELGPLRGELLADGHGRHRTEDRKVEDVHAILGERRDLRVEYCQRAERHGDALLPGDHHEQQRKVDVDQRPAAQVAHPRQPAAARVARHRPHEHHGRRQDLDRRPADREDEDDDVEEVEIVVG
mmetsp:Transcript_30439/g.83416  ORF Transcript_30439/g.83416 Transcript_30439/m.83416 type:complete len:309 (+) Transcript_30439:194-1120(+)